MGNKRSTIPNAITLCAMLLGFFSILLVGRGDYETAAWLLLLCTLLDKLDGTAARMLKADNPMGIELDSLADLVTFVLSPAVLWATFLYFHQPAGIDSFYWMLIIGVSMSVYISGGTVRLAKFNITKGEKYQSFYFKGLATTLAGALSLSMFLFFQTALPAEVYSPWVPPVMALLGLLMNIPVLFPKVRVSSNRFMTVFFMVCGFTSLPLIILRIYPGLLFALSLAYIVVGFVAGNIYPALRLKELQTPDAAPEARE